MAIDYSKWDNIELSDDSDVEVHPNVDKKSFIRWKQRDIHEKRMQRQSQVKGLNVQQEMYTQLTKRVLQLLASKEDLSKKATRVSVLAGFDAAEKCLLEENPDTPTYNEMIEDLFEQVESDMEKAGETIDDTNLRQRIQIHQAKIDSVLLEIPGKLKELEEQDKEKITSEDYHEGWNSSFINKGDEKASTTMVETINTPSTSASVQRGALDSNTSSAATTVTTTASAASSPEDELTLLEETVYFSTLPLAKSKEYILAHPKIATLQQKDALLISCFDLVLSNQISLAETKVRQAVLLQWVQPIIQPAAEFSQMPPKMRAEYLDKFFNNLIEDGENPAKIKFKEEVANMVKHIEHRCSLIAEEQLREDGIEGVETIQLRSMNGQELSVEVPPEDSPEWQVFKTLSPELRTAIESKSIDKVNEFLAHLSVEDAEEVLDTLGDAGVLNVEVIEEGDFEELQRQAQEEGLFDSQDNAHDSKKQELNEAELNTAELVD